MKTLILFLTLSFLMNCYTYRSAVTDHTGSVYDASETYELQLNDDSKIIAENLVKENDTFTFTASNGKQKAVKADTIKMIRERKFSSGKTIGLTLGIIGAAAAVVVIAGAISLSNWDMNWE